MRLLAAALSAAVILVVAPNPLARPYSGGDLADAVEAKLRTAGVSAPQVTINPRSTATWGFGAAVRAAPPMPGAYPEGWLFVARRDQGRWLVAIESEPAFAELSTKAPILTTGEQRTLGTSGTATGGPAVDVPPDGGTPTPGDLRTGMRLPFAIGELWYLTGGPHPMSGGVRSSIDLSGGDGRVLAARAGLAYAMCSSGQGWIRVVHDRGFATDYYHLVDNIRPDGDPVAEGAFLGKIGNDVSCGGRSTGPHVHFSLRRDGRYVAIDRYSFGKWVIRATGGDYDGYARHGSVVSGVGARLYNYGALGFTQGVVDTDGGGQLNRRSGPGTGNPVVGTIADGATVSIACSGLGTRHAGRGGYATDMWNKLSDGSWVSDAYVWTGIGTPVNGDCAPPPAG